MLVSIIIPIYNAEKYLDTCLQSLLRQTYPNFEVLLVNDGSTDQTTSICDHYANLYPQFKAIHKANGGVSSARNVGLENAKGEKILFIDADDWVNETYIEDLMQYSECDLVVMGVTYINTRRKLAPPTTMLTFDRHSSLIEEILVNNYFTAPWAKLFTTAIINKHRIRFKPNLFIGEDTVFVLNYLLYVNSIQCISMYGYKFFDVQQQELSKYALSCTQYSDIVSAFSGCIEKLQTHRQVALPRFKRHLLVYYGRLLFAYLFHIRHADLLAKEMKYFKQHELTYIPDSNKKKWMFRFMSVAPHATHNIIRILRSVRK